MDGDLGNLKGRNAPNLTTYEGIEAWLAEAGPDGEEELRKLLAHGRLNGEKQRVVQAWVLRGDAADAAHRQAQEDSRSERSTAASESQAGSAHWANRLSVASLTISVIALVLAALAYFAPRAP